MNEKSPYIKNPAIKILKYIPDCIANTISRARVNARLHVYKYSYTGERYGCRAAFFSNSLRN